RTLLSHAEARPAASHGRDVASQPNRHSSAARGCAEVHSTATQSIARDTSSGPTRAWLRVKAPGWTVAEHRWWRTPAGRADQVGAGDGSSSRGRRWRSAAG